MNRYPKLGAATRQAWRFAFELALGVALFAFAAALCGTVSQSCAMRADAATVEPVGPVVEVYEVAEDVRMVRIQDRGHLCYGLVAEMGGAMMKGRTPAIACPE